MPKKFAGVNSKAAVARAKKASAKESAEEDRQKQLEDAYWKDDAKHVIRKQKRKEVNEKKHSEQQQKKSETAALLHQEEAELEKVAVAYRPATKVTRAQVQTAAKRRMENERCALADSRTKMTLLEEPIELQENMNRLKIDGEEARTVEEAIAVLSDGDVDDSDRHPERRMKAAFKAFEEEFMPHLKKENPGMRLSQLKHMLSKEWNRSPQNPLNKQRIAYNAKSGS